MSGERTSLRPVAGANRAFRERLGLRDELLLALLPTLIVLGVLAFVEVLSRQRLLFASLASSAFLIYLDPQHGTNTARTLSVAHLAAAGVGFLTYLALGPGYVSGGSAMVVTIVLMIVLDAVHPPAVSTALSFAFRAGDERSLVLFALAVGIIAVLVVLEQATLWLLSHRRRRSPTPSAQGASPDAGGGDGGATD
ncbi:MAG: HPP family protein [Chloroflexales bacterium]|nr:HPP family protein [Chloroflexales bacterium]